MTSLVLLTPDGTATVDGESTEGAVLVTPDALEQALGWSLDVHGLCRGDVCVPVAADHPLRAGDRVDLREAAELTGRDVVVDSARGIVAISVDGALRRAALDDGRMPDLAFADLDGEERAFSEFGRRKKLLVAFASW